MHRAEMQPARRVEIDRRALMQRKSDLVEEAKKLFTVISYVIRVLSYIHVALAGAAIAYLVILSASSDYLTWLAYFSQISYPADIFFHVILFLCFLSAFLYTGILYYTRWNDSIAKIILLVCVCLMAFAMMSYSITMPLSLVMRSASSSYGEWYNSSLTTTNSQSVIYNRYYVVLVIRLLIIIVTSPFVVFFVEKTNKPVFRMIFNWM